MSYSTQDNPKHGDGVSGEAWLQTVGWGLRSSGSHGTDFSTQIMGRCVAWATGPVMAMGGAGHWWPSRSAAQASGATTQVLGGPLPLS